MYAIVQGYNVNNLEVYKDNEGNTIVFPSYSKAQEIALELDNPIIIDISYKNIISSDKVTTIEKQFDELMFGISIKTKTYLTAQRLYFIGAMNALNMVEPIWLYAIEKDKIIKLLKNKK
jgi:hypothetical protein